MTKNYDFKSIEKKWQSIWEEIKKIFSVPFGYVVDLTYWEQKTDYDFFFGGIEAFVNVLPLWRETDGETVFFVSSLISLLAPPMTPARATAFLSSAMTSMVSFST